MPHPVFSNSQEKTHLTKTLFRMLSCGIRFLSLFSLVVFIPSVSDAQFLRLGPFDIAAQATLEGVYTTNVEQERESVAKDEREDYYFIAGLALSSPAKVSRNTTLNVESSLSIEKHFNRPDLDNSSNPFGLFSLNSVSEFGHYTVNGDFAVRREIDYQEKQGVYIPGDRKKRDVSDMMDYGGELQWKRRSLQLNGSYAFSSERHQDEDFRDGDQDETTLNFSTAWIVFKGVSLSYDYERTKTELLNPPEETPDEWEVTESFTITLGEEFALMKRPLLTYSFAVEKEDTREKKGEWEPVHTLNLSDDRDISSSLKLLLGAQYSYEDNKEDDDISFVYNAALDHALARTASQRLGATREPVRTFGSTTESDSTTIDYTFTKRDLFIYNLTLTLTVEYSIDKPLDEGDGDVESEPSAVVTEMTDDMATDTDEKIWTYSAGLGYVRAVTRKIQRAIDYTYRYEDSNMEEEILDEHRVTLSYIYTF